MKRMRVTLLYAVTVTLLVLVSMLGGGTLKVAAQPHHDMSHHGLNLPSSCQAQCISSTGLAVTPSEDNVKKHLKKADVIEYDDAGPDVFRYAFIKKFTSTLDVVRNIRPPDIIALTCSYRF